ncbi:hypothetical protein HB162lentus_04070 [Mammaliicoccus lentus]
METILKYISSNTWLTNSIGPLITFFLGILINPLKNWVINKSEINKNSKEIIRKINLNSIKERNEIQEILKEFKENENLKTNEYGSYLISLNNSIIPNINAKTYGVINHDVGVIIKKTDILLSKNVIQTLKNLSHKYQKILTENSKTINKKTYENIEDKVSSIDIVIKKINKFPFETVMQLVFLGEGLKNVINTEEKQKLIQEIENLLKQNEERIKE